MTRWLMTALVPALLSGCITVHTAKPLVRDDLVQAGIETQYDNYHDRHAVLARHLKVPSNYTNGDLMIQAFSRGKGLAIQRPDTVFLVITAAGLQPERLDPVTQMSLSIDGKTLHLPVTHEGLGTISGICVMELPFAQFQALAKSKRVSGKIGDYTFTTDDAVRRRLQALVEALSTPQPEPRR